METNLLTTTSATISKLQTATEAAQLSKVAKAASDFYKAKDDQVASQQAKEIYIRSAHRAGELLLPENIAREIGGDRKSTGYRNAVDLLTAYQRACQEAGITEHIAKVWQKLAGIPLETLELYFTDPKYLWDEFTIKGLFIFALGKENGDNPMTLEGALKKFQDVVTFIAVEYPDAIEDMQKLFDEILD